MTGPAKWTGPLVACPVCGAACLPTPADDGVWTLPHHLDCPSAGDVVDGPLHGVEGPKLADCSPDNGGDCRAQPPALRADRNGSVPPAQDIGSAGGVEAPRPM